MIYYPFRSKGPLREGTPEEHREGMRGLFWACVILLVAWLLFVAVALVVTALH